MHKIAAFGCALLAATLLFLIAPPVLANYEQGLRAFNAAAYSQAEEIWAPLAEAGDARSQYALGVLYETKAGADETTLEKAIHWYSRAAAQDHPDALTNLGSLYAQGLGVARDATKAFTLWSRAANLGNALAAYNLGLAYYRGEGVLADVAKSRRWFEKSADSGLADAQFAMGQMYLLGVGIDVDSAAALAWFQRAEQQGHGAAADEARKLREIGVAVVSDTTMPPQTETAVVPGSEEQAADEPVLEEEDTIIISDSPAVDTAPATSDGNESEPALPIPPPLVIVPTEVTQPKALQPEAPQPETSSVETKQSSAESAKGIVVWLGTFAKRDDAEEFRRKTLGLYGNLFDGHPISIVPLGQGSGYRVFAQGMLSGADADVFCLTLRLGIENAYCAALAL